MQWLVQQHPYTCTTVCTGQGKQLHMLHSHPMLGKPQDYSWGMLTTNQPTKGIHATVTVHSASVPAASELWAESWKYVFVCWHCWVWPWSKLQKWWCQQEENCMTDNGIEAYWQSWYSSSHATDTEGLKDAVVLRASCVFSSQSPRGQRKTEKKWK